MVPTVDPVATVSPPARSERAAVDPTGRLRRADALPVLAVVAVGLALRIWVLSSNLGPIDSDEAAGGLIARHFLDGDGTVFLWGNNYGGTLEAILAAPLFALLGTNAYAWKSVMIAMYALACGLTWRIGLRTVGPHAARFAAGLLWLSPAPLVLLSTKARLYYGAALVLAAATVLLCLRLAEARSRRDMALLGFVLGLGLWTAPFVFYVAVPIVAWLAIRRPRRLIDLPVAMPGALLGAAPWLAWNLRNDWLSLEERPLPVPTSYRERLGDFFTDLVPRLTGLRDYSGEWVFGGAGKVIFVALLAGGGALALWCVLHRRSRLTPLVLVAALYPFLFAVPKASWYVTEPRYGLFLAPVIALLLGAGITRLLRRPPVQMAALGLAALASVVGLASIMDYARDNPGHHDLSPRRLGALADELERREIDTVAADYWIAYALSFETDEDVIATPTGTVRYQPYQRRVEAAGMTDYVFFRGSLESADLEKKARKQGIGYEQLMVDEFVLYRLERPLA